MAIPKKHGFSLLKILIIALGTISIASAYVGTGFSHNVPASKYNDITTSDILNKYNQNKWHESKQFITKNL